jgi:DNA-binding PadR family transcriptional regulator
MALSEAILVCLADEPLTGYDLAKTFNQTIGFFWHADHQQIYRVLRQLKDAGFVTDELVVQQGRPNKKVYSITRAGRERLMTWSQESEPPASVKDDMMVKLYGLEHVDVAAMRDQVAERLTHHRARLALYERIEAKSFTNVDPVDPTQVGRLLGLHLGLAYERVWIAWCHDALASLDRLPAGSPHDL